MTLAFPTIERPETEPAPGGELWALYGNRVGDNRMIEAVAGASGLNWRGFRLRFNPLGALPNMLPNGSLFTLKGAARKMLAPPWPAVVLTSGKRAVPAALKIRAASGGRTKLVHLGRPQAPLSWFDLVVTTPQYGLPARPNVLTFRLPATAPSPIQLTLAPDLDALPRPRLVGIVGGSVEPQILDAGAARAFAAAALDRARKEGGALLVATSPRTSPAAVAALREAFSAAQRPVLLSVFGDGQNRYRDFLSAADAFLVTDDSVSMAIEAAETGAPVALFRLPQRPGAALKLFKTMEAAANARPSTRAALARWVELGLIRANRDIAGYMISIEPELATGGDSLRELAASELAEAAHRVRELATSSGS